jgi:hypothetical protein
MINAKLQSIIDTKSAIGNAIVNKGGTITGETPFFNYAAQIDGISTGTPQTIFAASDGSKWALTNAVNLVNSAGNVTYDFNRWQPANNSTSDPILNVGTVGANISGNIRIVQVNQVNIAQYGNIVAQDNNGAKYVGYNGYDAISNPTPTGNTIFNRWLLNNSASGTIVFANATIVNGGTFNGPNSSSNESNLTRIGNTPSYGGDITTVAVNNGFIYAGGIGNTARIQKFNESNLTFVGNSVSYGGDNQLRSLATNNGFIYAGGRFPNTLQKFGEANLVRVGNTASYGGAIQAIVTNNGFVYIGGEDDYTVKKYHESNLAFVGNSASYGGSIRAIAINNGFIYATGDFPFTIRKYNESTLSFDSNSVSYNAVVRSIAVNNGFIYIGGDRNNADTLTDTVQKFGESNLTRVGNTVKITNINTIRTNNGFIYAGSESANVSKFYESNLTLLTNTADYGGEVLSLTTNNGFIYVGGRSNRTVQKFQQAGIIAETLSFFNITTIKE